MTSYREHFKLLSSSFFQPVLNVRQTPVLPLSTMIALQFVEGPVADDEADQELNEIDETTCSGS